MRPDDVEERFKRIEGYIDALYDMAYGALDAVFIGVDHVYQHAKKRAEKRAQRVSVALVATPERPVGLEEKVESIIDYYESLGKKTHANLMRKQRDAGLFSVIRVDALYDDLPDEYKTKGR